jgi:hypothetical protein
LALVVLAISGYFADQAITAAAERSTAAQVSRALDADAEVDFHGWPVTVRMLGGTIPTATMTAIDVPLEQGGRLDALDIELTDVRLNLADFRNTEGRRLPPARRGTFVAELGEGSVAAILQLPDGVSLTLDRGVATIKAAGLEVAADVTARDGDIVVSLAGPLEQLVGSAEVPIDLSDEPGSPSVKSVQIRGGVITLRGALEEVRR